MGRLMSDDFAEMIMDVPEQDYSVQKITDLLQSFMPHIADEYGIAYLKVKISRPGKGPMAMQQSEVLDIYEALVTEDCYEKSYHFEVGHGGSVDVLVGVKNGIVWDRQKEEDIRVLTKTNYLLMGRAQAMHDLLHAITVDAITDIPNQAGAGRYLEQLVAGGRSVQYSSNFLNICDMKLLNERFTEKGGNELLRRYAGEIRSFIGEDGLIARLGGDNFLVIIAKDRQEEFLDFMKEVRIELTGRTGIPARVSVHSRIGIYEIESGVRGHDIIENAGIAIQYAKKENNPNIMKFNPRMKAEMRSIKQLEDDLQGALDREEFIVYYQPKAEMTGEDSYSLCGGEALVRWIHEGKMIPPMEFIPFLERNGMVALVDFYMLDHVCRDIKKWLDMGLKPVPISVNFSRRHLKYDDIGERIMAVINKYGIDTSYLEIEITESYDQEDLGALSRFEKMMHSYGMEVSVDDFGSGFSSLKMIKNIVTDTIKLDKSLIDGIGGEYKEDEIILSHIIHMIKALGKKVIAEGVETKEQAEFLRKNNCSRIQGYLYGKPMPVENFEALLNQR